MREGFILKRKKKLKRPLTDTFEKSMTVRENVVRRDVMELKKDKK